MAALLAAMAVLFGGIGLRLVVIQGISSDHYLALGLSQRVSTIHLPGGRGSIFDRTGHELAVSINQTTIWANPQLAFDPRAESLALAPVLGMKAADLQSKLSSGGQFVYLARKVDDAVATKVKALKLDGVFEMAEPKRFLPDGGLASSLIGTVGLDNTGLSGLEQRYDQSLAGQPGTLVEEHDPKGNQIPGGVRQYQPPANGTDLVLTIDQSLQYQTEQTLAAQIVAAKAKGGMALVMDTQTGELLAVANLTAPPGPNQSPPQQAPSAAAFTSVFEPGSVNKLVTISAALASGVVVPSDRLQVPMSKKVGDATFSDAEPHPVETWSVTDILANSSNVGTIMIAEKLGKARLDQYLRSFGFGQESAVRFPGESAGLLPDPAHWSATSIATVPIGQGVAVTAVQMLTAYNTIANGGVYVAPKLVAATVDADGHVSPTPASARHRVVSPQVAQQMTTMLGEVVRVGTGQLGKVSGYTVAGKTGTARVPLPNSRGYMDGVYESSFAGFAPAEHPALTSIVVLDQTTAFGGTVAAPVFSTVVGYGLRHFRVPPPPAEPPAAGVPLATPNAALAASGEKLPRGAGTGRHRRRPRRPQRSRPGQGHHQTDRSDPSDPRDGATGAARRRGHPAHHIDHPPGEALSASCASPLSLPTPTCMRPASRCASCGVPPRRWTSPTSRWTRATSLLGPCTAAWWAPTTTATTSRPRRWRPERWRCCANARWPSRWRRSWWIRSGRPWGLWPMRCTAIPPGR